MKYWTSIVCLLLILPADLLAGDIEPQAQGNATVTVGNDTATWPVWKCTRMVLAHQLPGDDIRIDAHVKLIDYDDVIQMVLKLNGKNYVADIPARFDVHDVDYEGTATRINPVTMANDGEERFSLTLRCNP